MKRNLIFFFLLMAIFAGCSENNSKGVQLTTTEQSQKSFTVTLDASVTRDDDFALYYTTDETTDFSKIPPVWIKVKGSSKIQQIVFPLPKNVVPTQLRIDLGQNQDQKDIYLKKVRLNYLQKQLEIPGTLIFSYFRPDLKKTKINATTGMVRGIIKDGVRQSPSLYPKEGPLSRQIEAVTQ